MAPPPPPPSADGRGRRDRSGRPDRLAAVVVCLPGLEQLVAAELDALGVRSRPAGTGAVAARLTTRQLYDANVRLATATRVLVEAGELTARSFAALEERIDAVDLAPFLDRDRPVRLRITSHRSKLHHTGAVEERLRRVLALGPPPPAPPDGRAQLLVVRIDRDRLTLRVDASGAPLHHRGWRGPAGKAPLRETLAAAALAAVGWEPHQPLVDPFAGSGTIPIEAARRAAGIVPGAQRSFAFERWPSFAPGTWASVRAALPAVDGTDADPAAATDDTAARDMDAASDDSGTATDDAPDAGARRRATIVARDRDAGAVAAIAENAQRAGVADRIDVAQAAVSALAPPPGVEGPGWIVTNPPWGGRLSGGGRSDLRDVYARLGQVAAERFPGWGLALLVPDVRLAHAAGVRGEPVWRSRAGPSPVHLMARPPG